MSLTDQIEECDVHSIAIILCGDSALANAKYKLARALGISATNISDYEQISRSDTYRFLNLILNEWISKNGQLATRERLIDVLRKAGFVSVCGKLQNISCSTESEWFDVGEDVHEFTGREEILIDLHKTLTEQQNKRITVITTLHGLGGIGKTSLAVHYAWLYYRDYKFYQNVIWINSETTQTMNDSFNRLADKLVISTVDKKSKRLPLREIVCKVYEYFNGRGNTLFILDNATNYESIKDCLPPLKTPVTTPPFVLLTSRHSKWGDRFTPIALGVFLEVESVKFFTNYLKLGTESEISFAKEIAGMLENLPLAVRQAGAYVKKEIGLKSKEECLEEYITIFRHKSEELLGYEYWRETGDNNYVKTTLLAWDLTLERIRKENEYTEVVMHIIAYLNPDNIPTQLFESLIPEPKDDTVQYTTWLERFRSLCGCKVESNVPQSTAFNIMPAIKLLADYSMINPQTSFRRGMISVHRLVQRVVRIQAERAHEFSKLRDCVELFNTHFNSDNSSHETEILIHAETLTEYIKEFKLSSVYHDFIQLVKRKLENLLEKQITLFESKIDTGEYEQAFEISRNSQLFGTNVSVYNLYLRGTFGILLDLVDALIKSVDLEALVKVFNEFNQPYFLAFYSTGLIEDELWVHFGSILSKCFLFNGRYNHLILPSNGRYGHLMGELTRHLLECFAVSLLHLKRTLDLAVVLQMIKDILPCLDGKPDNENRKLGLIREYVSMVEQLAKQNIDAFVNYSLVSVMALTEYVVHPDWRRQVRTEVVSVVHDIFGFSTTRLDFLMLLKFSNSILLFFQRYREHNAIPRILKEVILRMDSTSENNSEPTVLEIQIMARIIYEIVTDEHSNHDADMWSQLLHISKLNYEAIRVHSIFGTASLEAGLILCCLVVLDAGISEILEFSRNYVANFRNRSELTFESSRCINDTIHCSTHPLEERTRGLGKENEKYTLLLNESIENCRMDFEIILGLERKKFRYTVK